MLWCFVGLPCVCLGDHCDGCEKTHSSPANTLPFEYLPQRSGDEPHPGAPRSTSPRRALAHLALLCALVG